MWTAGEHRGFAAVPLEVRAPGGIGSTTTGNHRFAAAVEVRRFDRGCSNRNDTGPRPTVTGRSSGQIFEERRYATGKTYVRTR